MSHNPPRKNDLININEFIDFLLEKADKLQRDAGFSGAMSDYGASALRDQVQVYRAAQKSGIPECWGRYVPEYNRETDPEYEDYLRLKDKFE